MEKTDTQLILAVLQGDLSSFETIVKRYQESIWRHTFRILKDPMASDDATQETFIRAFKHLKDFKQKKSLKPWLYKIATNFCLDYLRKNSRLNSLESQMPFLPSGEPPLIEKLIHKEAIARLREALNKLPAIYFEPLNGYYFADLSYQALAQNLDLPINTLKTRIRRGKIMLARLVK
jgi:RNA polymerase sigma-70 factor (ECF subfamily)